MTKAAVHSGCARGRTIDFGLRGKSDGRAGRCSGRPVRVSRRAPDEFLVTRAHSCATTPVMTRDRATRGTRRVGRETAKAKLALQLLVGGSVERRGLSNLLRQLGIPRSTFYHLAEQLAELGEDPAEAVLQLLRERKELESRARSLERDLLVVQEAMGKPWRRSPSGERPSDGQ